MSKCRKYTLEVFLNEIWPIATVAQPYVMVRRLPPHCFVCDCLEVVCDVLMCVCYYTNDWKTLCTEIQTDMHT